MLERIAEIQGIGLLHQANGKPCTCQKATLVYADNGRGKSTLATIFRSASSGNAALIAGFKTVDGTLPPKIVLQFGSGHKVSFENGGWSEQRPELLIFDADFIGRNVHSGGAVSTDHRKNLLEFALGEAAVAARAAVDKTTSESKAASEKVQSFVGQLSGYHLGLTLAQFEHLPQVSDIDAKLADLQKRLVAAGNVAAIQAKPVPKILAEPSFDIDGLFVGLGLSLKDVHADAEKVVKQHIAKLGGTGAENWLSQGRQFGNGNACPFCDQDISSNDLVRAYQTHFNAAYGDLKTAVTALLGTVTTGTAANIIDAFAQSVGVSVAQAAAWVENVPIQAISFDADAARGALATFREFVVDLARRKNATPAESLGTGEEKAKAAALWEQVLIPVRSANAAIKAAEGLITGYKGQLISDSVPQLEQQIQQLQATKRRYDPKVVELLGHLAAARKLVEAADKAKKAARDGLDSLMTTTLKKYQTSINALLKNFGASFSLKGMSANFRGNAPRSEYGLLLRGRDVALEGGPPSFATALSDGDKRTLAFAFFIASTLEDPKLATRTVVIDDPMCSLDVNRRHHTRTVLKKLHSKAAQLIVLAHDAYFLRDLRDALRKENKAAPIAIFQLAAAPNNYTNFASLDIDKECESVYFQHHRLLNDYAAGNGGDLKAVAKAIRPMLEGYFLRRFPGIVPKGLLFGEIVTLIRDAVTPNPLCHAKNLVDVLNEINSYAGKFHHDAADSVVIVATELKTFVEKSLSVVHKGAPL
ncbi:MAG: AAA family ATPase [Betaproteobacteria bacterium]|nr:AAA family ATPase [Betaproteobacteria bacterium]